MSATPPTSAIHASVLCREPFRIFFPLAILIGATGMVPWLLFGRGVTRVWPGTAHAITMTQSFLVAVAVGFLGTMIPRRTGAAPLSWIELGLLVLGLVAAPVLAHLELLVWAELAYVGVLVTLAGFVIRRLRARGAERRVPPPSFVLIPIGLACGIGGAGLMLCFLARGEPIWAYLLGRQLVQQGLMLSLVLALGPMLTPIITTGAPPRDLTPHAQRRSMALHAAAGLTLVASFAIEQWASERWGLLVRGAVCGVVLGAGGALAWGARKGLHRVLYRIAVIAVPTGLLAAGLSPVRRVSLLHLTFVSGLSMMVFAVSLHVTLLHTGRERDAERSPWPVALVAFATIAAALVRASIDLFPAHYFGALTLASGLWMFALVVWAAYVLPKLLGSPSMVPSAEGAR